MIYFFVGFILGALLIWVLYLSVKRELIYLDEEKLHLHQEKQIVVEFMHNLVEAIGEGVDRQELLQRIVHAAVLSTGSLSACIYELQDKNILKGVAVEGLFPPQKPLTLKESSYNGNLRSELIESVLKSEAINLGEGLIGHVAQTGKAVMIPNGEVDTRIVQHADPSLKIRSLIVAPIYFRNKILGAIAVANPSDGLAFSETDFSLVQSLAEQAGMAIHNADLMSLHIEKNKMDVDLTIASSIQRLLLPKEFPEANILDIDAQYHPAQKVGGDLYDIFQISPSKVGIAIADVSGKGVPASIIMAICHTHLRHFAQDTTSPSQVLTSLNQELVGDMPKEMFITMIFAIIDLNNNTLTFARAGHEPPLLLYKDDNNHIITQTLNSEGIALGMVSSEEFQQITKDTTIGFKKSDILILYTDGLSEAVNEMGEEFSCDRLIQCVQSFYGKSAQDMNLNILSSIDKFCNNEKQIDDMTIVCIKHI